MSSQYFKNIIEHKTGAANVDDITPPTFAGIATLTPEGNGSLSFTFSPATDGNTPIRYEVYLKALTSVGLFSVANICKITAKNFGSIFIDAAGALLTNQVYYVGIRAVDPVGNRETNIVTLSATSLGVPDNSLVIKLNEVLANLALVPTNPLLDDDTRIDGIKAKTDNLPSDPADNSQVLSAISSIPSAPSSASVASAVRTELATELARVDVAVSSRNAVAPDNAGVAAIKAKTDNLPASPASTSDVSSVGTLVDALPTLTEIEASTVLAKQTTLAAVKIKTDNLPAAPASEGNVTSVGSAVADLASDVDALPILSEIEASAVLAKEATVNEIKTNTDLIPALV